MKILFIANARRKGGLSGSDAIYEAFIRHWGESIRVQTMLDIDYKPFFLCYIHRIVLACFIAIIEPQRFTLVYSCSDFWMDSIPALIHKLKGSKWVAGFYLKSTKENKAYYYTQLIAEKIIRWFADMVIVTNPTMDYLFPNNKKTWINGVIHAELAEYNSTDRLYDAVFCGRIHPTKGIDELIEIWKLVVDKKPNATLAVIGDGDLGIEYMRQRLPPKYGVRYYGFQGDKRYEIFKNSKSILYPTPFKYDHFSIAPVEAMACGCPIISFDTPTIRYFEKHMGLQGGGACPTIQAFANMVVDFSCGEWEEHSKDAKEWAIQFDEKTQAERVYKDIKERLFNADIRNWA